MSIMPEQLDATGAQRAPEETAAEREPGKVEGEQRSQDELVVEDLLVEDVSIDGMCGVY